MGAARLILPPTTAAATRTHAAPPPRVSLKPAPTPSAAAHPALGATAARGRRRPPAARLAAVKKSFTSFDDMITGSELPVLVDFYATWCGPCVMMANILSEAAPGLAGVVKVVKIDTEKYTALASRFRVEALPTLVLFKGGRPVARAEGVLNAPDLTRWVRQELAKA